MLRCKEASELLSQAQDRQMQLRDRLSLGLHVMLCHGCRNFQRQLAFIRVALRRLRDRDENH